jgi:hypothetical protein
MYFDPNRHVTQNFWCYVAMSTFKMLTFKISTFKMSTFEMSTFKMSTFKMLTFKMSTSKMSTFKMSTFKMLTPSSGLLPAHCHHQIFPASTSEDIPRIHLGLADRGLFFRPSHSVQTAIHSRGKRRRRYSP